LRTRAVIFDAYGTLLDVHAAMARHAARLGPGWEAISQEWRTRQLEYSWVRSLAGRHRDFEGINRDALDTVAARHGITDAALLDDIMDAYIRLAAFPEVPGVLRQLKAQGLACAILSNGTPAMLAAAVAEAGIGDLLDAVLSIEAAGIFKPDPRVYALATDRFALPAGEMAFLSSNPWDAFGALECGFRAIRVNRQGLPDEYGLRARIPELPDLAALPALLSRVAEPA
jgi:2-haloacid dehalogenase